MKRSFRLTTNNERLWSLSRNGMKFPVFVLLLVLLNIYDTWTFIVSSYCVKMPSELRRGDMLMRERKCDMTGQRKNKCHRISKSRHHTLAEQGVNLQWKKFWWEEGKKFVRMRVACRTIKTILKNGLHATAKKYGVDLNKFSISYGTGPTRKKYDPNEGKYSFIRSLSPDEIDLIPITPLKNLRDLRPGEDPARVYDKERRDLRAIIAAVRILKAEYAANATQFALDHKQDKYVKESEFKIPVK